MPDLITMTCPTCGAKLKLAANVNMLVCANCGNEHMVHRGDGAIYLAPMAQDVSRIHVGVDKTAAELAVARLTKEVQGMDIELEEARDHDYSPLVPMSGREVGLIIASLLAFAAMVNFGLADDSVVAMGCLIVCGGSICYFIVLNIKRQREMGRLRDIEIDKIQEQYDAKVAQLERNREIANS